MAGIERSVLPLSAGAEFGVASHTAIVLFLVTFGVVKACANLAAGRAADLLGRRKLLIAGWIAGLPVPFMLIAAPSWGWIAAANILLGVNQGLCWSMTVTMKIDIAGPQRRGLAAGLNEFAGYTAAAAAAYTSALLASSYGLRGVPYYPAVGFAVIGLLLSLFAKETRSAARGARPDFTPESPPPRPDSPSIAAASRNDPSSGSALSFGEVFSRGTWRDRRLVTLSQAGFVNNANDGLAWAILPLFFVSLGFSIRETGLLAALYPAVWGCAQVVTGPLSDRVGRRWMIAGGMMLQGIALCAVASGATLPVQCAALTALGLGTAMAYPVLIAAVGDASAPEWRASALGVYRFWRDLGYAAGALAAGIVADLGGIPASIVAVGVVTALSGAVVAAGADPRRHG